MKHRIVYRWKICCAFIILLFHVSCGDFNESSAPAESDTIAPPEWAVDASIYEVNIRQYTNEGTFDAFTEHIPRLKEMGIEILWLMPIHPIGEKNRKGTLGSYYSITDYKDVN
ncbi:MAG: alpha-amylase family glycosyl hydrolase, partial [Bacteroidota bacterium]